MKREIRIIGIDDAPFDKFKEKEVLIVGAVFRGGDWLDGVLSSKVRVDGSDSTSKLVKMINKCKFRPQLQCVILDGIAFGGFNVINIEELNKKTKLPVIVVIRRMPDFNKIKRTLKKIKQENKYKLIEKAGKVNKIGQIYFQSKGISLERTKEVLKISCTRSLLPEALRAAHIIAAGIALGESRGKA